MGYTELSGLASLTYAQAQESVLTREALRAGIQSLDIGGELIAHLAEIK